MADAPYVPSEAACRTAALADRLRVILDDQPLPIAAGALAYETVSAICLAAATEDDADRLIDAWAVAMKQQVRHFGVWRRHP